MSAWRKMINNWLFFWSTRWDQFFHRYDYDIPEKYLQYPPLALVHRIHKSGQGTQHSKKEVKLSVYAFSFSTWSHIFFPKFSFWIVLWIAWGAKNASLKLLLKNWIELLFFQPNTSFRMFCTHLGLERSNRKSCLHRHWMHTFWTN